MKTFNAKEAETLTLKSKICFYTDVVEKTLELAYYNIDYHASLEQNQTSLYVAFLDQREKSEVFKTLTSDGYLVTAINDDIILIEWKVQRLSCCF